MSIFPPKIKESDVPGWYRMMIDRATREWEQALDLCPDMIWSDWIENGGCGDQKERDDAIDGE